MPSGRGLHRFCPKTRKGGPQADDSLRGRWCQRPSVPSLRGMEVTAHPHVLVRGMRTQSRPGRWAAHLLSWEIQVRYIHTRPQGLLAPLPHHPLLKVSVDRQRRDPNAEGGTGKSPTQKVGGRHLRRVGLHTSPVVPRLMDTQWDQPLTNQSIPPAPQATS